MCHLVLWKYEAQNPCLRVSKLHNLKNGTYMYMYIHVHTTTLQSALCYTVLYSFFWCGFKKVFFLKLQFSVKQINSDIFGSDTALVSREPVYNDYITNVLLTLQPPRHIFYMYIYCNTCIYVSLYYRLSMAACRFVQTNWLWSIV